MKRIFVLCLSLSGLLCLFVNEGTQFHFGIQSASAQMWGIELPDVIITGGGGSGNGGDPWGDDGDPWGDDDDPWGDDDDNDDDNGNDDSIGDGGGISNGGGGTPWQSSSPYADLKKPLTKAVRRDLPEKWTKQNKKMNCVAVAMEYIANILDMSSPNFSAEPWRTTFESYFYLQYGKNLGDVGISTTYLDPFMEYCFNAKKIYSIYEMFTAIEAHSPIFAVINNSAGKHAVTIVGYTPTTSNFIYIDPSDGGYHWMKYEKIIGGMYVPKNLNLKSRRRY